LKFKAYLGYSVVVSAISIPSSGTGSGAAAGWPACLSGRARLTSPVPARFHAIGGFVGLAGAIVLGPRFGKYDKFKKPGLSPDTA
jgi:Amt family ammonium transporter